MVFVVMSHGSRGIGQVALRSRRVRRLLMMFVLRVHKKAEQGKAKHDQGHFHLFPPKRMSSETSDKARWRHYLLDATNRPKINKPEDQAKVTLEMRTFLRVAGYYRAKRGIIYVHSFSTHYCVFRSRHDGAAGRGLGPAERGSERAAEHAARSGSRT